MSAPNPDDPLSENIAKHWKTNEAEAVETGKICGCNLKSLGLVNDLTTMKDDSCYSYN